MNRLKNLKIKLTPDEIEILDGAQGSAKQKIMKIRLLIVGKIENAHADALAELYLKRIKHYIPITVEVIKPEKIKKLSDSQVMDREGEKIINRLFKSDYNVIMDKEGKQFSSMEFSHLFNRLAGQSTKQITFVIGGPLGLADSVKRRADHVLSFSKMTYPHELAAVLLLEQIYRAQSILRGEKYHK